MSDDKARDLPDQARDLLDGTTPGPWKWREDEDQNGEYVALSGPDGADALRTWDGDLYASGVHGTNADKALAAAAPALAAMVAGMREEWGVSCGGEKPGAWWASHKEADQCAKRMRICIHYPLPIVVVRRYVTEPEASQ